MRPPIAAKTRSGSRWSRQWTILRSLIVTTEMYRLPYGRPVATALPSDAYSSVTVESSPRWVRRSKQRSRKMPSGSPVELDQLASSRHPAGVAANGDDEFEDNIVG